MPLNYTLKYIKIIVVEFSSGLGSEHLYQPLYSGYHCVSSFENVIKSYCINDILNTFYLWLYGFGHMVKNHSVMRTKNLAATTTWDTFF